MPVFIFLLVYLFSFILRRWWGQEGRSVALLCKWNAKELPLLERRKMFSICEVVSSDNIFYFLLLVKQLRSSVDCKNAWNNFCWLHPKSAFLQQNLEGPNEYCAVNNSCLQTGIKPVYSLNPSLVSATVFITTGTYFCCNVMFCHLN